MKILIIDDEKSIRTVLRDILLDEGYKVIVAENGRQGLELLRAEEVDICFVDVWMPEIGGIDVLSAIKKEFPAIQVVMISGHAKIDQAVRATKLGSFDFLEKPLSIEKILTIIEQIRNTKHNLSHNPEQFKMEKEQMIGNSSSLNEVRKAIETASSSEARVLILGENGTGKELVARAIHENSLRKHKPFLSVNCAAIPENLIESELFGYVKGAFTGAYADRAGKLELANSGTFFLDEVADMSFSTQVKLLRVLQEMKVTRIGTAEELPLDVRLLSATNKDLREEVRAGRFREDLYYRLNVIPIRVPALRERKEDIPLLVEHFNKVLSEANSIEAKTITTEAIEYLQEYNWPGNIRQLRNIMERLLVMVTGPQIGLSEVNQFLDSDFTKNDPVYDIIAKYRDYSLNDARLKFEREFITTKLSEHNFNLTQTAKALGVFPSNLSAKIAKLGIKIDGGK